MKHIYFFTLTLGLLGLATTDNAFASTRIINGTPVPEGTHQEVVMLKVGGSRCSATIVGPKVVLTAAHCVRNGGIGTFQVKGKKYSAKFSQSPLYSLNDHDIALGIVDRKIKRVIAASIGYEAQKGMEVTLLGYGCTKPGGGGGNDGVLRKGLSTIIDFRNYDIVTRKPGGAASCYGDSGGPAYLVKEGNYFLVGLDSKGNIKDTSFFARLDIPEAYDFLRDVVMSNPRLEICGYNKVCPPIAEAPPILENSSFKFKKAMFAHTVKAEEQVWLDLKSLLVETDSQFESLWFLGPMAPEWLKINQELDILFGTPSSADKGSDVFSVVVRDDKSAAATLLRIAVQ